MTLELFIGRDGFMYFTRASYNNIIWLRSKLNGIKPFIGNKKYEKCSEEYNLLINKQSIIKIPRMFGLQKFIPYLLKDPYIVNFSKKNILISSGTKMDIKYKPIFPLKPNQRKAYNHVLKEYKKGKLGGILKMGTGIGKTFTSLCIANAINYKTLIIVKTRALAYQWISEIEKFFPKASKSIVENTIDKDFNVCIRNKLMTIGNRKCKFNLNHTTHIHTVIVDEVHSMISKKVLSMYNIISRRFILGITATTKKYNGMHTLLSYYIGPVLYNEKYIYDGAAPNIFMIMHKRDSTKKLKGNFTEQYLALTNEKDRIDRLVTLIDECYLNDKYEKILIIGKYKSTLNKIYDKLKYKDDAGVFYSGIEFPDKKIILGIEQLSAEGLNIPDCNCLIMINPPIIKKDKNNELNFTSIKQMTGRCLRKKWYESPDIYVINDKYNLWFHYIKKRMDYFRTIGNVIVI